MKRTYNDVALETILFVMSGKYRIIVEDYDHEALRWRADKPPVGTWEGAANDFSKMPWKYQRAKVYEVIPVNETTIKFKISTQFEQY